MPEFTTGGAVDILLSIIVILLGAWARAQDKRIAHLEKFKEDTMNNRTQDALNYVTKQDFQALAQDLKESLHRIEDKIEKLRDHER